MPFLNRNPPGEVHHRKPFPVGCLGLTAIRGDEKVRLVDESTPDM